MGGLARGCEDVRGHANDYEGVQGHVSLCEDVGGCARVFEGMQGHESVRSLARAGEDVQELASSCVLDCKEIKPVNPKGNQS